MNLKYPADIMSIIMSHGHHHHHHDHDHDDEETFDFDGEIVLADPLGIDTRFI